jgi:IS30 family transposase
MRAAGPMRRLTDWTLRLRSCGTLPRICLLAIITARLRKHRSSIGPISRRKSSRTSLQTGGKKEAASLGGPIPAHIRSDNGPEFALALRDWIVAVGAKTAYIEPGSSWENGYCESFNGKLRDELLNGEIFYTMKEAQIVIENWRRHFNTVRPHSSLGYRPPAPEALGQPQNLWRRRQL